MSRTDLVQDIAELFRETGQAHHAAFIDTDGADPDWAIWYAGYLQDSLGGLLEATFVKSELVYLLIAASKEQDLRAPGSNWTRYYAKFFVERYV